METNMEQRIQIGSLSVDPVLHRFIEDEALPGSGVESAPFWKGLDTLVHELGPRRRELLETRNRLQATLDDLHRANGSTIDPDAYHALLKDIGYLVSEPNDVTITTDGVDPEVSAFAGPQLVVPLLNARFATNAANARWGSLYDAFYGTDVIDKTGDLAPGATYNERRGAEVVRRAKAHLDEFVPLERFSHDAVTAYAVDDAGLIATSPDGSSRLVDPTGFVGYRGDRTNPEAVVLVHNDLHLEIQFDRDHPIGSTDGAGVKDVLLEAALTSIMDLEDSVAAVDVTDKVAGYRNWLHLMQGTLSEEVTKNGRTFLRSLAPDREYTAADGSAMTLPGRALLFIRQVGHLMTTDAVLDRDRNEISEGFLDAIVTALGSTHDLRGNTTRANSRTGAMYAVKPKMHGPDEVKLTVDLFAHVEKALGLPALTIKVGIMDEERRTSANLKACIAAASDRVAFINTGFLDRTGDEIHTSMHAGPMVRKAAMRSQPWIRAYEDQNVDIGLECGLAGKAQIGKGMWAAPDNLADMLEQKIAHPQSGATTAWVPSPTAATLHALHYHQVDVHALQRELTGSRRSTLAQLLTIPVGDPIEWTPEEVQHELDNNVQSTLGYVVRWIDVGVGCSKVPDLEGVALMEDRATCRISSQHVSNWLLHGVVTTDDVDASLRRMAVLVDEQNAANPGYQQMAPSFDGEAFLAARDLLLRGAAQPSGYTEPILHVRRANQKSKTLQLEART